MNLLFLKKSRNFEASTNSALYSFTTNRQKTHLKVHKSVQNNNSFAESVLQTKHYSKSNINNFRTCYIFKCIFRPFLDLFKLWFSKSESTQFWYEIVHFDATLGYRLYVFRLVKIFCSSIVFQKMIEKRNS